MTGTCWIEMIPCQSQYSILLNDVRIERTRLSKAGHEYKNNKAPYWIQNQHANGKVCTENLYRNDIKKYRN